MTTDNKTLADAQPGGRVRLGDQAERARFEAWAGENYHLQRMGDVYRSAITTDAWRAWQAALSAQPSPGGQGDALALIQRYDEAAQAFALSVADDRYTDARRAELRRAVTAARNEVVSALAARQPVEVSEGGFRAAASRQTASAESNATAEALIAAARQLNKQPDSVALGEATEFCIEKGGRQPAGEQLWCLHVLGMDDVYPAPSKAHAEKAAAWHNEQFKDQAARLGISIEAKAVPWPHSAESHAAGVAEFIPDWLIPQWQLDALEANAKQPAQAVDLDKVRQLIGDLRTLDVKESTKNDNAGFVDLRCYWALLGLAGEVERSMTDSQAVGK